MSAQHTPGILGFALFREGHQQGIERSLPVAKQWVDAEIVPLCAASERDELLEALKLAREMLDLEYGYTKPGDSFVIDNIDAAIAKAIGGAA